jgi:alkanesulfonate monooxygenase SsuD/methylene tetrahydromethanopterin reductase-like flavin-dependent oxidoreductase (luciferase family)
MRHGLFLPPFDALADPDRLVELAIDAERAGWDGFFLWDHLKYRSRVRDILDPYISLTAIAVATSVMELGVMVTPLVRRRPAVLARQAVTLDHVSHGRLVLGFGIGDDFAGELSSFGDEVDAKVRGQMLSEVLTDLMSGQPVEHDGEFYRATDVRYLPVAARPGGIPIWLAARWPNPAPLRRAAKYHGVFVIGLSDPHDIAELRRRLSDSGADLEHFDIVVLGANNDDVHAWDDAGVTWRLEQIGPFEMDYSAVREVVLAGPPRARTNSSRECARGQCPPRSRGRRCSRARRH